MLVVVAVVTMVALPVFRVFGRLMMFGFGGSRSRLNSTRAIPRHQLRASTQSYNAGRNYSSRSCPNSESESVSILILVEFGEYYVRR